LAASRGKVFFFRASTNAGVRRTITQNSDRRED
jgi:hypothetical protein